MHEVDADSAPVLDAEAGDEPRAEPLIARDDVIQCFKIVLGREPENEYILEHHRRVGPSVSDLFRALLSSHEYRAKVFDGAFLSIKKCYYEVYLSKSLPFESRTTCFLKNHQLLDSRFTSANLERLYYGEIEIWRSISAPDVFVTISICRHNLSEGEMCLIMRRDTSQLYIVSFTFVPGSIMGRDCDHGILISGMQGTRGQQDNIKQVSKALREVHPQALLFSILCGIGGVLGSSFVACVQSQNHIYFQPALEGVFARTYDQFMTSQGDATERDGYWLLDLPLQEKPLSLISAIHRLRTKKKRSFKETITGRAAAALAELLK